MKNCLSHFRQKGLVLKKRSESIGGRLLKRAFDLGVALLLLTMLSPVILVVGVLVRTKLGSPVIFRQPRPGLHGKIFSVLKFRTMNAATDAMGQLLPDEARLTALGKWLRRLSLDELPQLMNVLRGEMSLVGPRPLLVEYLPLYSPEQARRHEARPGITGWAQVNGRNAISWEQKFEFDVWYVDHQTFWLDMKILVLTAKKVLARDGISHQGQATMARFMGSNEKNK